MKTLLQNSKILSTVFLLILLLFSSELFAQTRTSTSNGNWNVAGTWANANITRTGTVTCSTGSTTVTGNGTAFLTELTVGSVIQRTNGNAIGTVASITSNTSLTLTSNAGTNQTGQAYRTISGPPSPVDAVVIDNGDSVTLNISATCASLTLATGNSSTSLSFSGSNTLTVDGAVSINAPSSNNVNKTLSVANGTLSCTSITMASTTNDNRDCYLNLTNGTIDVTGNIAMNGTAARNAVTISGTGVINIGGTITGGSFSDSSGTVNYNGSGNQSIGTYTYNNLTTSTSGTNTLASGTVVNGTVLIQGTSTLVAGAANLISNTSPVDLNGGTYRTGASTGYTDQVGVLTLLENSNIILGTGNHTLTFANSNAASWASGKMLTITGWTGGYNGTAATGSNPKIFFGSSNATLTTAQLNQIQFFNGTTNFPATLLATGELVPVRTRVDSFSPDPVCAGSSITITGIGFTGATAVRVNGANVGSYHVDSDTSITAVLTTTNTSGTVSVITASGTYSAPGSLTVNPVPTSVTAAASVASICVGNSINLTSSASSNSPTGVTLINENFNGSSTFTAVNNGTGGTVANASWTIRPNGYNSGSSYGITISSNDSSQFYLSDSDRQGSGSTTETILTSPAFSTVGLNAASLSFYHYYRHNASDNATVEVSTNGTSWTALPAATYNSNQGSATNFSSVTISLGSYLNQATVYIRFKYRASWGYYWAIDNVSVTGTLTTAPATYAWTSTPSGFTSSVQNPTGVSPTVATSYTVVVTNTYGCTASATTASVTVNDVPAITSIATPSALCVSNSFNPSAPTVTANGSAVTSQGWEMSNTPGGNTYSALTLPYTASFADNGKNIRYFATNGCGTTTSNVVVITINNVPAIATISAPAATCAGVSLNPSAPTVTANGSTVTSQGWQIETAVGSNVFTNVTLPYTPTYADNGKKARYTATNSCGTTNGNEITLIINDTPTVGSISAPSTLCAGGSLNLSSPAVTANGSTVSSQGWEMSNTAGGNTYSALTLPYTVNFADNGKNIRYFATNGCGTTTSNVVAIAVNAASTAAVISGSAAICAGAPTNIQVAITGGVSPYTLVYTDGTSNFTINGYVSGTNISVSPLSTTTYSIVSVSGTNGCPGTGNSGSAVLTVTSTSTSDGITWSNGAPSSAKSLVFTGNATINSDLAGCALKVTNNAVVTLSSGYDIVLEGAVTVDFGSTLTLNNNTNLIQHTTQANTGDITVKRNSSALKRFDYTIWSSPVTGQGLYAFSPLTFPNRFYVYNTNAVQFTPFAGFNITGLNSNGVNGVDTNNAPFELAKGYMIRTPWNHPTAPAVWTGSFTGVPNNGDITYALSTGYNAVGNPYPSTINVYDFIDNNPNISGPIYFWRKTNDAAVTTNYATLTKLAYTKNFAPGGDTGTGFFNNGDQINWVINVGQGFVVTATNDGPLYFNNDMRRGFNSNQFFRVNQTVNSTNSTTIDGLYWLNLSNQTTPMSQMAVGYTSDSTLGIDRGIDGRNINQEYYLASLIEGGDYSIQGRSTFQATDVVPMTYKLMTAGTYSISVDQVSGIFNGAQTIYLRDLATGTVHDLSTGAYSFTSEAGTFNSRFEIIYQPALGIDNPHLTEKDVIVYTQNDDLVVTTENIIMSSIKVFDIRGRLIQEMKGINSDQARLNVGKVNQVLLVQITTEDGVTITKKVIK